MPAGTQITGEDGIIAILDSGGTPIGEIPCLTAWTLESSAAVSSRSTKCMKSNDDGGSTSTLAWDKQTVEGKSWNVTAAFFWQEDQLIPAAVQLDPTKVGEKVQVKLYPHDEDTDAVVYSGTAVIESVSTPSEVNGDVRVDVTFRGDGTLTKALVA